MTLKLRFGVKGVDLAHGSGHEQVNDGFGFGFPGLLVGSQKVAKGQDADSKAGFGCRFHHSATGDFFRHGGFQNRFEKGKGKESS